MVIESNMDGVEVFIDGKSVGVVNKGTALRQQGMVPGAHTIQGVRMGYEPDGPREETVYPGQATTVLIRIMIPRRSPQPAKKTDAKSGPPSPPQHQSELVDQELGRLHAGRILYNPPREMQVAVPTRIQVRIAAMLSDDARSRRQIEETLQRGLERPGLASQPLPYVSTTMKVRLTGAQDEFDIRLQSDEEQLVQSTQPTEWSWTVTPRKAGKRRLHLAAVAVVKVAGTEKVKNFPVYDTDINVRVNVTDFLSQHWKELAGLASASGLTGWLAAKLHRRRGRPRRKKKQRL